MWDKPDTLRQLANALFGISFVLALYGALHYALHLAGFPLRAVQLSTAPIRVDSAQIEAVVRNELRGNFFTVNMESTQHAFEKLPWVRKVSVRRHFPWRLDVSLEEHVALAHWNGAGLVNTHGEVFAMECERGVLETAPRPGEARVSDETTSQSTRLTHNANQVAGYGGGVNSAQPEVGGGLPTFGVPLAGVSDTRRPPPCGGADQVLPKFIGQPDTAVEVAQMYKTFGEQLAPLKQEIAQISLSPRHAWQLRLSNGMVLELGHEQSQQRLARFVAVYPYSLASRQRAVLREGGGEASGYPPAYPLRVNYVDLRYQNGFAAYLPGYTVERKKQG